MFQEKASEFLRLNFSELCRAKKKLDFSKKVWFYTTQYHNIFVYGLSTYFFYIKGRRVFLLFGEGSTTHWNVRWLGKFLTAWKGKELQNGTII